MGRDYRLVVEPPEAPDPAGDGPAAGASDIPTSGGQYFDAQPKVKSRPATVVLPLPDLTLTLRTDRGVFAKDEVDPGTRVLLSEPIEPAASGTILDLGCGYGPIAVTLARRRPGATVWAVDINRRALDLCAQNAADAGLGNVSVFEPNDVPDGPIDEIWSNPPIRIGKSALHDLLDQWLGRLSPGGRALLVVQKHLGSDSLHAWLNETGRPTRRVVSRRAYRILEVRPA